MRARLFDFPGGMVAATVLAGLCLLGAGAVRGEETQAERFKKLEQTLSNVKLSGRFTVLGKEDKAPAKEEYVISSAKKLEEGDLWLINTRIKYGDKDATVPLPLEIKWAGDTPIITLTNFTIPNLGTFSSRVVIYDGMYAGTWQHGQVKGHLFGTLEKLPDDANKK